jgi:hypothetical protein
MERRLTPPPLEGGKGSENDLEYNPIFDHVNHKPPAHLVYCLTLKPRTPVAANRLATF